MRWAAWHYGGMAKLYEKMAEPMERAGLAEIRARLAADLHGRILELGCGTGLNFTHYSGAAEVIAIEPLDEFREMATQRAKTATARITVQSGDAQCLPFSDASFDGALQTLVFCSVADEHQGLLELRRVLRPAAPVRFVEHVRSPRAAGAILQDIVNPLWRWATDGCNLNRDTVRSIETCGFTIEDVQVRDLPRAPFFPIREVHARA